MRRSLSLIILFATSNALPQTQKPSPPIKQESSRSLCSNVVALTGNVQLNCSGLTPAQVRILASIPILLRRVLANGSNDAILAKLDELVKIASQPALTVNAPNGIGNIGGTLINPTVINNGPKPPEIKGFKVIDQAPARYFPIRRSDGVHPSTSFTFYLDAILPNAYFAATCDRPCTAWDSTGPYHDGINDNYGTTTLPDFPNVALWNVLRPNPFPENTYWILSVVSLDDKPPSIKSIQIIPRGAPDAP